MDEARDIPSGRHIVLANGPDGSRGAMEIEVVSDSIGGIDLVRRADTWRPVPMARTEAQAWLEQVNPGMSDRLASRVDELCGADREIATCASCGLKSDSVMMISTEEGFICRDCLRRQPRG